MDQHSIQEGSSDAPTILANWLRDTWTFLNLFVSNLKIGDNINPSKASYKVLSPAPPKQCWSTETVQDTRDVLDSGQSTLSRGGRGEDITDLLLKIWLSVPNVLATIVRANRITSTLKRCIAFGPFLFEIVFWVNSKLEKRSWSENILSSRINARKWML